MKLSLGAALAVLAIAFPSANSALAANGPHILIFDRQAVMNGSKLGENIRQQIMAYEQKAQTDLGPEGQALQTQSQALQQMPAAVRAKKGQELQAKETAYRQKVQDQQSMIQGGELAARKRYMTEEAAIVHAIMTERGADAVLIKAAVVDSAGGTDITRDVIARLDKKITGFKVPLVKPSLADQLQMMQQQQQQQQQQ
ncbi:MAG TPA: OmpH family outer membrane protein [Rhizomicrobium sp.]|nr:OmpH family outer membrane protein [Rhizomicrobium sp.]